MAYARIDEGFWTDPKIKGLSIEGKIIAAWLFTNPHRHFSGIYYLPKVLIAEEIGVSIGVCNRELKSLEDKGFIKYADEYSVVWVIKMLPHQTGGGLNEKQAKGIATQLKTLHGCPLIKTFLETYQSFKIPFDRPIDTSTETKSQSKSQSKSKSQSQSQKDLCASPPPNGGNGDASPFFSCQFFDVSKEHREKLAKEYPAMNDPLLISEFSKMEDWLIDNPKPKRATGKLKNSRMFIRNWLNRTVINPQMGLPLNKDDLRTAGNLAAGARLREKWKRQEQS
jgi:hypothetical protein